MRALEEADVVAYFAKRGSNGNARGIVGPHYRETWIELPLVYPVTTEIHKDSKDYRDSDRSSFYEESVHKVEEHLENGRTVAVLSEGDPLFYGSYMHLHVRLVGPLADRGDTGRDGDVGMLVADRHADRAGRRHPDRTAGYALRVRTDADGWPTPTRLSS